MLGFQNSSLKILILHGPNLNLLGEREPEIYGRFTLPEINTEITKELESQGAVVKIFQANAEGELIGFLHTYRHWADGVIFNPAAYSHYSYALRDAVSSIGKPTVEVHLSDIQNREDFRKVSVIAPVCVGQVCGLGWRSYIEGFKLLSTRISKKDADKK